MTRFAQQPILLALIVAGVFCSPVTYQGGSAAAHPHMFLQLWHDAASGSFSHHGKASSGHARHAHHGHAIPAPLTASERPDGQPTLTAFVVSGWSQGAMLAPAHLLIPLQFSDPGPQTSHEIAPGDRFDAPEPPPPRDVVR